MTHKYVKRGIVGCLFVVLLAAVGCGETWDYRALRDVQTSLPGLMDKQWSRRRDYSPAEMLPVQTGGTQTLLIASRSKKATLGDVAQLDEQVRRTFVIVLDSAPQEGKTYKITPDNGRLIEGTTFRPAWRPYRGIEGEVTVLSVSQAKIRAAVRATTLTLRQSDAEQRLDGVYSFKPVGPADAFLAGAQIRMEGVAAVAPAE